MFVFEEATKACTKDNLFNTHLQVLRGSLEVDERLGDFEFEGARLLICSVDLLSVEIRGAHHYTIKTLYLTISYYN